MRTFDAVVIGGSAGGFEALQRILPRLPKLYRLAVVVVLHQHRNGRLLPQILASYSVLPVVPVEDARPIEPGCVYVCPPNYHVLVETDRSLRLSTDVPVHYSRPSIDVLFESAARVYRERLVGVLLSGSNADGAAGLAVIRAHGGWVACEDPQTALEPTMPTAGCQAVQVDWVASSASLGLKLAELCP